MCLSADGIVLSEAEDPQPFRHLAVLTCLIDDVLRSSNITLKQLHAIAVSAGPGSFSGLRIGAATAKALCYTGRQPLLAVSTLAALAAAARLRYTDAAFFATVLPARQDELFFALYNAALHHIVSPACIPASVAPVNPPLKNLVIVGPHASRYRQLWHWTHADVDDDILPSARSMVPVAEQLYQNRIFADPARFEPEYLKPVYYSQKHKNGFHQQKNQ